MIDSSKKGTITSFAAGRQRKAVEIGRKRTLATVTSNELLFYLYAMADGLIEVDGTPMKSVAKAVKA